MDIIEKPDLPGFRTDNRSTQTRFHFHMDLCIGCQYCTWNCPYSVPSFQPERGVVSKCDMCVNRLKEDRDPACAQACPAGAIEIETVPLEEVFATYEDAGAAPGMPAPEISMPSTKITLPEGVDPDSLHPVTNDFVEPEEPHSPLIFMTVLTQIGLGGFAAIYAMDLLRSLTGSVQLAGTALGMLAAVLMGLIGLSLAASTLHLGRPAFAFRAIRNWRTSWLSREVLALSLFAKVALAYAAFLLTTEGLALVSAEALGGVGARLSLGAVAVLAGIAGIYASARLYRVPARPAWNFRKTTADFFAVAWIVGPAVLALSLVLGGEAGLSVQIAALGVAGLVAYVFLQRYPFFTTVVGTNIAGNFIVEAHRSVA